MPYRVHYPASSTNGTVGSSGSLGTPKYIYFSVNANGDTTKKLPANCLVMEVLVKSTTVTTNTKLGSSAGAEDIVIGTPLAANVVTPFLSGLYCPAVTSLFASGITGTTYFLIVYYEISL